MEKKQKTTYSLPVRIMAILLTLLVASGTLTYLIMFITDLLG